jgi:hypothetical protein
METATPQNDPTATHSSKSRPVFGSKTKLAKNAEMMPADAKIAAARPRRESSSDRCWSSARTASL